MINLNDIKYNIKTFPTSDDILDKVSDYSIWKFYYPELEVNELTNSPLRKDRNPSFSVFMSSKYNRLLFKDFATQDRGDVFVFLTKYLNLKYNEVINKIVVDFGLTDWYFVPEGVVKAAHTPVIYDQEYVNKLVKESAKLEVKVRDWNKYDIQYWNKYGVSLDTLVKYGVLPISYIFLNDFIITADKLAYAYTEFKDGVVRFKTYQPYSDKLKWISNLVEGTLSGWRQLDATGELLIIPSSLKDGMCLHDLGYTNILAPQTEGYIHKEHIINHLKNRFTNIYTFYDNDRAGIMAAEKTYNLYGIKSLFTDNPLLKDPSDYYMVNGKEELLKCIQKQL